MIRVHKFRNVLLSLKLIELSKLYSNTTQQTALDPSEAINKLSKIITSTPPLALHTALDHSGIDPSTDIVESLLRQFENAGLLAFRFFQWAEKQRDYNPSVRAYHIVIESLGRIRQFSIMWDVVNVMRRKGLLNVETFCIVMRKYARAKKVDEAIYAFNVMDKYGVDVNLAAFNGLLSALCKTRNVRKAQDIFNGMKGRFEPDLKSYSILVEGWGRAPNLPKAREVFREMVNVGCEPDIVMYGIMVDVLCKAGRVDEAVDIVKDMQGGGCRPTPFIYSVLVHTYGVENRIEDAVDTFLEMEKNGVMVDVVAYNALISAFCKVNKVKNAYRVLNEMESKGITPNARTCNIILNCLIGRRETDEAYSFFRRMVDICDPDTDTYTIMIKMFCANDDIARAFKVWRYMSKKRFIPSMHTYSTLINGLCEKGDISKACVFMEEMIEKGMRPSDVTFGRFRQLLIKEKREDVLKFLQEKMNLLVKEPLCD